MNHQDFKTVYFTKNTNKPKQSFHISSETKKQNQLEDEEIPIIKTEPLGVRQQLEKGRLAKSLTRKEFAQMLGMRETDYNKIERGEHPMDGKLKDKIQRILSIKIQKK
jgi:ribosome-binding protein aMBF1 (putative translation factor)